MNQCAMFKVQPPAMIIGGRYGDIIQLLPCFKAIHDRTGLKPIVICSHEYATVFDGVSYVKPYVVRAHWWQGMPMFKQIAEELYGGGVVVQFWQEDPKHDDTIGFDGRPWTVLQSHGLLHGVNLELDPDYGTSMARRCGFSREEWLSLPLVFDKRNPTRERELAEKVIGNDHRLLLLYNLTGISSPFPFVPEILNPLMQQFGRDFKLVDLSKINGWRIYDLLGLYDRATVLITSDTYSLHLAAASAISMIAFTVDGWTSSAPKGNCVLHIKYSEAAKRVSEVMETIRRVYDSIVATA